MSDKALENDKSPDGEARCVARMLRVSPQKLNLLAAMIRGKEVARAINDLAFSRKRIATAVGKAVKSAVANAEHLHSLDENSNLVVAEAYVGKCMVMKRFRARARGRSTRIKRPMSSFTVVVRRLEMG